MINKVKILITLFTFLLLSGGTSLADYYCEVMTLQGKATVTSLEDEAARELKEGDLIKEGDRIRVEEGTLDLAFDKEWNNVTRLARNTEVSIRSMYPTGLAMERGDIFARLEKLPKNSTFEIQTPTCVAAVRGSAYRTIHENGESRVLNYASSPIEVFGLDAEGNLLDGPVILGDSEKTEVKAEGEPPAPAERMTEEELKEASQYQSEVNREVETLTEEGRVGKVQEIKEIERDYVEALEQRIEEKISETEAPRATENGPEKEPLLERVEIDSKVDRIAETADRVVEKVEQTVGDKIEVQSDRQADESGNVQVGDGGTKDSTINLG